MTTVLLVDSTDIAGSIGRSGYLRDHLTPLSDANLDVDITRITAGRCDIVAQRLTGAHARPGDVPPGLEDWYAAMTEPIEILDTTSLFILSLADAVNREVFRHRASGVLVQPPPSYRGSWTDDQTAWLDREFEPAPPTHEHIAQALAFIAHALEPSHAELIIFNTSTFVPDEKVYWFRTGEPETTSVRAARMNLTVDLLLKEHNVTLVDVDRVTAELGARHAVVGAAAYSDETLKAIAREATAVILDLEQISHLFASDAMQLNVPRYDRRTTVATLTRWHVAPGGEVARGDTLFDLRFGNLSSRLETHHRDTDKTIDISVVAGRSGYVDSVSGAVGAELTVGTRVGIVTTTPQAHWDNIDNAPRFPVGVRVTARNDE